MDNNNSTVTTKQTKKPRNRGFAARCLRTYLGFVSNKIFYHKVYTVGRDRMPNDGSPTVLVQNHQNCLCDPLALVFILSDRKPRFLARASVFKNPILNKVIRALGALPTYRLRFDGKDAAAKNQGTLDEVAECLSRGETVVLYPEGKHQDKRWLGDFAPSYLKMAFGAAEADNFEREVFIMPSAHHYSSYLLPREDMVVYFDEPISLKPYYELYREQPRVALVQVNEIVRSRVADMMLNITDLENYKEIDFLRQSEYGDRYATRKGLDATHLPDKLQADKLLVARLDELKAEQPEAIGSLYDDIRYLRKGLEKLRLGDRTFVDRPTIGGAVLAGLLLLLLLPLFLYGAGLTWFAFLLPYLIGRYAIKDKQFRGTIYLAVTLLLTYPLCGIVPAVVMCFTSGLLHGLGHLLIFTIMLPFVWNYMYQAEHYVEYLRALCPKSRKKLAKLGALRNDIFSRLDSLLG